LFVVLNHFWFRLDDQLTNGKGTVLLRLYNLIILAPVVIAYTASGAVRSLPPTEPMDYAFAESSDVNDETFDRKLA
jgi:hypothetical protein